MNHRLRVLYVVSLLAGCQNAVDRGGVSVPLALQDQPLISQTLGAPVCDNVPEPDCYNRWRALWEAYIECTARCDYRPCGPDDLECMICPTQCFHPGQMNCPTVSIRAECSNCAADLVESVKTCTISNIVPPYNPPTIDVVVPCDQNWAGVGECTECGPQNSEIGLAQGETGITGYFPAALGRRHCTCPSETGTNWTSICRVPYQAVPRLVIE